MAGRHKDVNHVRDSTRSELEIPLRAGVRQCRGRPEGNKGWTSRGRQPHGLPRGHPRAFRCVPECDSKEAAPRATRAGRQEDVSRKACPEGICERRLEVEG